MTAPGDNQDGVLARELEDPGSRPGSATKHPLARFKGSMVVSGAVQPLEGLERSEIVWPFLLAS